MSFLTFDRVVKKFGAQVAIDQLSLEVERGEFVVLLGPSGCGKTTLMRCLAGLERVDGGQIHLDGEEITNWPPQRRKLGMVFQSYALWPHMSVKQNILYPLKIAKVADSVCRQRLDQVLQLTELTPFLHRYPAQLSGGQRQRVAIARAVALQPRLLLMDEPLSNLDAVLRESTRTRIREIHNSVGATTLFVTHDQAEAMSLADRIVLLRDGKIEQVGAPEEIYRNSANAFVAGFIGSPPTNLIPLVGALGDWLRGEEWFQQQGRGRATEGLLLGARPEDIVLASPQQGHLPAEVRVVEHQGAYTILMLECHGVRIKLLLQQAPPLQRGERVFLRFQLNRMALFSRHNGAKLT